MAVCFFVLSTVLPLPPILAEKTNSGPFSLVNLKTQQCVSSESADGRAEVEARPCDNETIRPAQLWVHVDHAIISLADGKCLDSEDYSEGARVVMKRCNGRPIQGWTQSPDDLTIWNGVLPDVCLAQLQPSKELRISKCNEKWKLSQKFHKRFLTKLMRVEDFESPQPTCNYNCKVIIVAVIVTVGSGICVYTICKVCRCSWMTRALTKAEPISSLKQPLNDSGNVILEETLQSLKDTMLNLSSKITHIAATLDTHEQSSSAGTVVGSWKHVDEKQSCFRSDTFVTKATDAGGHEIVPVQKLSQGDQVVAANSSLIEVLRPPEQHQVDAIIKLQAGPSCLVVSPDHRILIPGNKTVLARELEVGNYVIVDGTAAKLTCLEWKLEPTMVLKVSFIPDLPVAGFLPPPAIWSKGSREKPQVRRGMRKPRQGGDAQTMPDTEPPLTP